MGCRVSPAGPADWSALRPVRRPRTVSSAARELSRPPWRERGEIGHVCPPRHPACVQQRAASLLRVSPEGPMTCGLTVWRAITSSIYNPGGHCAFPVWPPHLSGQVPCVSPWEAVMFAARWAPHVSAGVPRRFRRSAAGFPPGTVVLRRKAGAGRPRVPCAAVPMGPVPEPTAALFPAV